MLPGPSPSSGHEDDSAIPHPPSKDGGASRSHCDPRTGTSTGSSASSSFQVRSDCGSVRGGGGALLTTNAREKRSDRETEALAVLTLTVAPAAETPAQQQHKATPRRQRSMSVGDDSAATSRKNSAASAVVTAVDDSAATASPSGQRARAAPKRVVRTGYVNCRWLYNQVQASRGMILIDAREREAFEDDTIPSAISVPPMLHCRSLDEVESGILAEQRYMFTPKKRKLREVVLFGDVIKPSSGSQSGSWLRQLERLIVEDGLVTSVKLLYDGFLTFKYRYPFYTSAAMLDEIAVGPAVGGLTRTRSGTHNLNYPNEILEGFLFLGNMWHAQSKQVIDHLGITHIVNASLDIGDLFENDGVKYHGVKIKDKADSDISAFFDSTYAFIESAKRTQHGRVLVHCTQGISRSATLVIMYLMRANNWSLVTAVNFAMASRGVVYPNEGFVKALMKEEFRLYKGNSVTLEEIDTLLQHQIPDRPVPLQVHDQKSESCAQCKKIFSLLEWKHKCSYCRKECCSKCTSTRLANPEREKVVGTESEQRARRVCGVCVSRLWKINLPRPRKGLASKYARCKHLNVNSLSTFGRPVCISYFEGTEPQMIVDVIKTRFEVRESQIIDISLENGEPVRHVEELADEAEVFVSVGKAGNVQEVMDRTRNGQTQHGLSPQQQQRLQFQRQQQHQINSHQRFRQFHRGGSAERLSPTNRGYRERSSSEGTVDVLQERHASKPIDAPRTRSFQLDNPPAPGTAATPLPPALAAAAPTPRLTAKERGDKKFGELWKLSFPSMSVIERDALLKIKKPDVLMDVMLGISSLSSGALTIKEFRARLVELGYSSSNRDAMTALLETARRGGGSAAAL